MGETKELIFYSSKLKFLGLLLLVIVFVVVGIWIGRTGEWFGYVVAAFFGLGIPIFILAMFPNASYLKIQEDGFEFASLYRRSFVKWADIAEFGLLTQSKGFLTVNKMVGWDYVEHFEESINGRALSKSMSGLEAGLPDTYGMTAEELMALMVEFWEKSNAQKL